MALLVLAMCCAVRGYDLRRLDTAVPLRMWTAEIAPVVKRLDAVAAAGQTCALPATRWSTSWSGSKDHRVRASGVPAMVTPDPERSPVRSSCRFPLRPDRHVLVRRSPGSTPPGCRRRLRRGCG